MADVVIKKGVEPFVRNIHFVCVSGAVILHEAAKSSREIVVRLPVTSSPL